MASSNAYTVTTSAHIGAPASRVYAIIADYHHGHPRILPKAFTGLTVEAGGVGAGTIMHVRMRVFGRRLEFRAVVTEPEPGRVLAETHNGSGDSVTLFTVDPGPTLDDCIVTITTHLQARSGPLGAIERVLTRWTLERIYRDELARLNAVATTA